MASQRPGKEAEQAELGLVFGGKLYPKDSNGVSYSVKGRSRWSGER